MLSAVASSRLTKKNLLLLTILLLAISTLYGANARYQTYENTTINPEANAIHWIQQDTQGLLWLGTNKGLFSFDGYESIPHFQIGSPTNTQIKCGLVYKQDYFLLGTEQGLLMYHHRFDRYETFEQPITKDIRAIALTKEDLWLGCADGLFRYHLKQQTLYQVPLDPRDNQDKNLINTLLEAEGYLYIGSQNRFGRISLDDYTYQSLQEHPFEWRTVHSLARDSQRKTLWIGEGNGLTSYNPATNTFKRVGNFPVVKTISLDAENNLLLGTDNGLYQYADTGTLKILHNAQQTTSLANNIIWSSYKDKDGNLWFGTNHGLSMSPSQRGLTYRPIYQFTGSTQGNIFSKLLRDSNGRYWLGGDNGLIQTDTLDAIGTNLRWYSMSNPTYHLPHNQVRNLYEDKDKHLWISTDFGFLRYDEKASRLRHYSLRNQAGTHHTTWAFAILEDKNGNLWVSSYNGGLFKVNKQHLLAHPFTVADVHYSKANGLPSDNIEALSLDNTGAIWALSHEKELTIIHPKTQQVIAFPFQQYAPGRRPNSLMSDTDGQIWIGSLNTVVVINAHKGRSVTIPFNNTQNALVLSMTEVGTTVWATTTEGLWVIDKLHQTATRLIQSDQLFYSLYYDKKDKTVLLGGADGLATCSTTLESNLNTRHKLVVTSVLVNMLSYQNNPDEPAVRHTNAIKLSYKENNLLLRLSDLNYTKESRNQTYLFRIQKDNKYWTTATTSNHLLSLFMLTPGTYDLTAYPANAAGETDASLLQFHIVITPPWYASGLAKAVYLLFIIGLILWGISFFVQRNKLRIATIEREKTVEQSKLKIDFLTNIAHELKTPLSLIIAPLSKLIQDKRNEDQRETLALIQQNALKLNTLVHQTIECYRNEDDLPGSLLLSRVECVEFARTIGDAMAGTLRQKNLNYVFNANPDSIIVDIDVVKMESILNNLLSNACKFSHEGDTILLTINYHETNNTLVISVSDTGEGIPEKALPFIFQRFYQAPDHQENGGTGIGLYLVKTFTEQHGGTVTVTSKPQEGSTFTITLPLQRHTDSLPTVKPGSSEATPKQKPLMVIVEDNTAIATFIQDYFKSDYQCLVANNGKTGLKIILETKPDIILCDVKMPVMDGLEMCQRLRESLPTSVTPIILLTAKNDKETELKSIKLRIDAFVSKPFDPEILGMRVHQLMEAHHLLEKQRRIDKLTTPVTVHEVSDDEKLLAGITRIIEEQIANPDLNVEYLCQLTGQSQKQLYRKIKGLTGMSAIDYIRTIRMKKAALLLSNRNFTVAEVMYKVGFSNHSYFAKCFGAMFGLTPTQYQAEKSK
jgi:signal transduction histidine kinase/ligand-binding sensor domain-containing protein/AraC-like DNA-binding protein